MEKSIAHPLQELLRLLRVVLISIVGGALTGLLAVVIGSTLHIKH